MLRTLAVVMVLLPIAGPTANGIERLDVTLFMPCDRARAERAVASLEEVPGVTRVDLATGSMEVGVVLGPDFRSDPLALVQLLWEEKIFPNHIYLTVAGRATHTDQGPVLVVEDGDRRFDLGSSGIVDGGAPVEAPARFRVEVLDWIEDRTLPEGDRYTVEIVERLVPSDPGG